ncbi:MAG: D-glycero-beta-D-manno-heptose 1-phosphate adenylyltransferase [Candidatus Omnitrophota bacterium]
MRLIKDKIKSHRELKTIISRLKKRGQRIAFTNGCFDIIHLGHITYLEKAKKSADLLIVAINSDRSVKKLKGKNRPVKKLKSRMAIIAALESVDFVTYFRETTPFEIIKLLKPDILIKGGDWNKDRIVGKDIVRDYGGQIKTIPYIKGYSSSKIIRRLISA